MEKWREVRLGDVCEKIDSGATPKGGKEAYQEEGISLIRSQNVLDFEFSASGLVYINEEQASKLKNVCVESDDVLLNITGDSVARACMVDNAVLPARVNQHAAIIRGKKDIISNSYILYWLQLQKPYLLMLSSGGATRKALTKQMIEDIVIPLPDLSEQSRIVKILDDVQDKIQCNIKTNKNLDEQAQAIFKAWFVDFEPFGGIRPDNWEILTLGDISIISAGGDKPLRVSETLTAEYPYPIYSNGLTNDGLYGYTNNFKIKEESVTVSARGTIGFVSLRHIPYTPIVQLITLIPNIDKVSAKYLYLWLKNLHIAGTGITQQQLTVPAFKKTNIWVAPKDIMQSFTDTVHPLFDKIWKTKQKIKPCQIYVMHFCHA